MKSNEKKTSLAILSILAGVVYFITLIPYFEAGWEGGIRNVKETNQVQLNDQNSSGGKAIDLNMHIESEA